MVTLTTLFIINIHAVGNVLTCLFITETTTAAKQPNGVVLNFSELSGIHGYASEEHRVVTEDGYILTIFRMGRGYGVRRSGRPVILMHGLLQSADAWLDAGPGAGLAYLIADAGHDLWVGNVRGNYYSRGHRRLRPNADPHYWKFSVDEIGRYDLPATVDYVLKQTGADKVNYVGFSQGAGTYLIMCSESPQHCDKTKLFIGLAPASRHTNSKSSVFTTVSIAINRMRDALAAVGIQEMFPKSALNSEITKLLSQNKEAIDLVRDGIMLLGSRHRNSIGSNTIKLMLGHFPAGTSLQNIARYGQSMESEKFEKFNFGEHVNLELYGDKNPPEYNMSSVTVPTVVLYGASDQIVDVKDIQWLVDRLPNVVETFKVSDPLWNHGDMTYSAMTNTTIFFKINEYLEKCSNN